MVLLRMRKKRRHIEIQSDWNQFFSGSPFHFSDNQSQPFRVALPSTKLPKKKKKNQITKIRKHGKNNKVSRLVREA